MKGLIFTYLMTYGGALVSLFNPYYGLLIYISFAILKPEDFWYWSVPAGNYSRIIALGFLAGWALHGFGSWQFGKAKGVIAALIALWAWLILSAAQAFDQSVAWKAVESYSKIFLPCLVGFTLLDSVWKLRLLVWVIAFCHGYIALEFNLSYFQGFNRIKEVGFGGMEEGAIAIDMVTAAGLAFFLGLSNAKWWLKALALVSAALMAHVVLFSFNRGGMFALIFVGFVSFLLVPKRLMHYLVFTLAVVLALRLAGPEVRARFLTAFASEAERDASAQSRLELWSNCWDAMLKRPLLGIGPDHFPLIVQEYGWPVGKEGHSLWLQIGAELGFPGLFFLLLYYGICVARLWPLARSHSEVRDLWYQDVARMAIASLAGFFMAAQFISLRGLETPYYIVLIGAGALKLLSVPQTPSPSPSAPVP